MGSMRRILVVEDTPDNRRIMRDLLTSAGFEVIEAADGADGIEAAVRHQPDLILMDMQLPRIDGTRRPGASRRNLKRVASPLSP